MSESSGPGGTQKVEATVRSADGKRSVGPAAALSEAQVRALEMLMAGQTIAAAAAAANVDRGTVYRWIKFSPLFRAAYNAWQQEQRESCQAKLLECAQKAVDRVVTMVTLDHKLAFSVIKELGIFGPTRLAAIEPHDAGREIEIEQMEYERMLAQRQSRHQLPPPQNGDNSVPGEQAQPGVSSPPPPAPQNERVAQGEMSGLDDKSCDENLL